MENKSIKKEVILNLIQDLQRLLLPFINGVRGRFRIKYGMTQLYNLGFTLIELLVVVVIIAILAAVAVPQYKRAALKSRFSKVMPVAKSIVEAQEVYYLGKNFYAANDEKDLLDVSPSGDTTIELASRAQENDYNYVAASSTEVPGARYIMYQKHSPKFAGTIQCEADENNPQAVWLCSKGLNGQLIDGSINTAQGSYVTYLLSGTKKEGDTLPTSIAKLAASLEASQCAGKTNCSAAVKGENEVVVSECGDNMSYISQSGGHTDRGCMKTSYNAESVQTGRIFESCLAQSMIIGSSCLPTAEKGFSLSKRDQDKNSPTYGQIIFSSDGFGCIEGIGCARLSVSSLPNGRNGWYECPSGQIVNTDTLECETYSM